MWVSLLESDPSVSFGALFASVDGGCLLLSDFDLGSTSRLLRTTPLPIAPPKASAGIETALVRGLPVVVELADAACAAWALLGASMSFEVLDRFRVRGALLGASMSFEVLDRFRMRGRLLGFVGFLMLLVGVIVLLDGFCMWYCRRKDSSYFL